MTNRQPDRSGEQDVSQPSDPRLTLAAAFALATLWGANASAGELVVSAAASLTNAFKDGRRL